MTATRSEGHRVGQSGRLRADLAVVFRGTDETNIPPSEAPASIRTKTRIPGYAWLRFDSKSAVYRTRSARATASPSVGYSTPTTSHFSD